jgi:hypothetical protein
MDESGSAALVAETESLEMRQQKLSPARAYRTGSILILTLMLRSIDGSNIISVLGTGSFERFQILSAIMIPVYLVATILVLRQSRRAYLIAIIAFSIEAVLFVSQSATDLGFSGATIGNLIFALFGWSLLVAFYKAATGQLAADEGQEQAPSESQPRKRAFWIDFTLAVAILLLPLLAVVIWVLLY